MCVTREIPHEPSDEEVPGPARGKRAPAAEVNHYRKVNSFSLCVASSYSKKQGAEETPGPLPAEEINNHCKEDFFIRFLNCGVLA
ncbi:hypothetical protein BpOF4_02655 [Alkalihalophilus pseudofirmus OF4]|uniref:Uncharacterized protein n=1 Tax=Alkalihalophilus pseudofirmus (strain ATCC BAA-2126 / JCM 17055 / OF4) TaxID=398511 RepID=D3FW66_ALKPO|nr:hypothetical protein BpOF4_02655 [Alkalihalophilus pseudofirmus OF4]